MLLEAKRMLKQCHQQKGNLVEQIDQVTEEIRKKQNQLQTTRDELKELSMQEASLKVKRDEANVKCMEVRKRLYASREALQQIQKLYGKRQKSIQKEITTDY